MIEHDKLVLGRICGHEVGPENTSAPANRRHYA